jgi:hypothetical protein
VAFDRCSIKRVERLEKIIFLLLGALSKNYMLQRYFDPPDWKELKRLIREDVKDFGK